MARNKVEEAKSEANLTDEQLYKYDYMNISLGSGIESYLLDCYEALGWTVVSRQCAGANSRWIMIRLSRPHDITHRDYRQFLQVRVEHEANNTGKKIRRIHTRSNLLGLVMALIAAVMIALGTLALVNMTAGWDIAIGVICYVVAVGAVVSADVLCPRIRKREQRKLIVDLHKSFCELKKLANDIHALIDGEEE